MEIFKIPDKSVWQVFAKHHYLSHAHNNAAHVYVCFIDGKLAGFLSVLHFPHPIVKNMKRVHRLVILPDYQGAGFGIKFLNEIGKKYKNEEFRYRIVTSSPSLVHALKGRKEWACINHGRKRDNNNITSGSHNRITTSWELK